MFRTFISILDIQSWWEVPSIAHFCSLFRTAFNLLDFDIEDLEEALLTDGTEETSWLQELIVRLLTGCLPKNEISTFNYQMFLRRLFREKCKEHDQYNPFNTDIDFQLLPLRTKVDILHALCDFRLDAEDVLEQLKNLEADSLRVEPLGYDNNESAYWYFYGTRLYREDFKTKNNKKAKSVWQVVCFTEDDWFQLAKKFKKSQSKSERQLHHTLTENFLPELPRLFCEKERLARKRLLESQPRRTSSRLDTKRKQELIEQAQKRKTSVDSDPGDPARGKKDLERRRKEAYERRARLREQDLESEEGEKTKSRDEMACNKKREKDSIAKEKQNTDLGSTRSLTRELKGNAEGGKRSDASGSTTVGRQTNNSLASATGQIVIQQVSNPHRKKLKTSQVFCQTDEDLQTGMHKILDYLKNHEDAWPFVDPVEEEFAPNYYSIIRKPMDLQKMEERLDSRYYKSFSRFRGDFQLIVDNCRLYNGVDNEYTEMVGNLLLVFDKATKRYLDQITSSDDEIAVEFPKIEPDEKLNVGKTKKEGSSLTSADLHDAPRPSQVDKKHDSTLKRSNSSDSIKQTKNDRKNVKNEDDRSAKKNTRNASELEKDKKLKKNKKVGRKPTRSMGSPRRTRSRSESFSSFSRENWSSSPRLSSPASTADNQIGRGKRKMRHSSDDDSSCDAIELGKKKSRWADGTKNETKRDEIKHSKNKEDAVLAPKQKDKHNKLRETIEKLKAKSAISNKQKDKDERGVDQPKENQSERNRNKKQDLHKSMFKNKLKRSRMDKRHSEFEDENSIGDSVKSDTKKGKNVKNNATKNAAIEALTLATEQTLKDINKWLDDTPRLSEFSSASNSPSHYIGAEEFDNMGNKMEHDYRKRLDKQLPRKDGIGNKDIKRRSIMRDPTKFLKKREVQRTIDRLQPGKSKGNLLSNIPNANKTDDLFPLGPLSKIKDTKNSLIVKTTESTPKLSLGSVLDSFGKHKFVDDVKKDEEPIKKPEMDTTVSELVVAENTDNSKIEVKETKVIEDIDVEKKPPVDNSDQGKATPNLSAWFKAFGAPKVPPNQKKTDTVKDAKEAEKEDVMVKVQEQKPKDEVKKVPETSSNPESPIVPQVGQPAQRQRKMSTGSTVSERSSFSQDMDSPRVGIDERLGAYPAPYPSPLHRSPSGASPIMASPRPDMSPKATYPTVNGQIRVGFYQDTVSTKSSPEKSCSPRDNPQSPYLQYSEHVYTPSTTESANYSYNPSYYSQMSNYSATNNPTYNSEQTNPLYYDTNKSLTDQYQAKASTYHTANFQNIPPNYTPPQNPNYPANVLSAQNAQQGGYEAFRQNRVVDKQQTAMFPVKKRAYNESEQAANIINQEIYDRNYETNRQDVRPNSRTQYVHQNIPNPRQNQESYPKIAQAPDNLSEPHQHQTTHELTNSFAPAAPNLYNYNNQTGYLNIPPERPLDLNARTDNGEKKIDMSKYTNMGYTGADMGFNKNVPPQYNNYERPDKPDVQTPQVNPQNNQNADLMMRYVDAAATAANYRNVADVTAQKQSHMAANLNPANVREMSVPKPTYSTPTALNVDHSLGLRGNLPNLSHIVDRFSSENMYYSDKALATSHIYNKPMVTNPSPLPMFTQSNMAYDMQPSQPTMYNRQITELQNTNLNQLKQPAEKKPKRRKNNKTNETIVSSASPSSSSSNQGFQSYTGLKNTPAMEPSTISLKSVVPGSAFNFGPTPTGLGLASGLYGDKDTYPNFLEDYRNAPNYYMAAAAAAAHHRTTPDGGEKQTRPAHQPSPAATGYPFIGAPQPRPPSYPFMPPPHQAAPLMDASSPLYQQYLQAGVLHQGLLGPPGAYPPGYHPALSIRQPFDSMTRPSWL